MKIIAAILVGLVLPFTFITPAQAAHQEAVLNGYHCTINGNTMYNVKVFNRSKKVRKMNWALTKTSKGATFGYDKYNKQVGFNFMIPHGESATITVWSRMNQKTVLLTKTLDSQICFD